jgi:hypothetical protein
MLGAPAAVLGVGLTSEGRDVMLPDGDPSARNGSYS